MKKFWVIVVAVLVLAFGGCTNTDTNESSSKSDNISCTHTKTSIKNELAATCTTNGYSGDTYCFLCDKIIKTGSKIKAYGHDTEVRNKISATETSEGYTGDTVCKICGVKTATGQVIPKIEKTVQEEPKVGTVYITETGKRYHSTKHCTGLNNAKAIYDSTLSNAQSLGLTPCAKCY